MGEALHAAHHEYKTSFPLQYLRMINLNPEAMQLDDRGPSSANLNIEEEPEESQPADPWIGIRFLIL